MTTYAVYRKSSGVHFYNATQQSYNPETLKADQIGEDCVYVGDLSTAQHMVDQANKKIAPTFFKELFV